LTSKKRTWSLALFAFAVSSLAWGQSQTLTFEFVGGELQSAGGPTYTLFSPGNGSFLSDVTGFNGGDTITGSDLGQVFVRTGALHAGDLQKGGVLAGGGSFVIKTNGSGGLPAGIMFRGTFVSPIRWRLNGFFVDNKPMGYYLLTGQVRGLYMGKPAYGSAYILTFSVDEPFQGNIGISDGGLQIVVP